MLAHERLAAGAEEATQNKGDHEHVVELPGDRDEIGNEVKGEGEVADEPDEQQLAASRYPRVCEQARDEHDAVGDERRQGTSLLAASEKEEGHDERQPENGDDPEAEQEPKQPGHGAECAKRECLA